jgi:hypothetical protein
MPLMLQMCTVEKRAHKFISIYTQHKKEKATLKCISSISLNEMGKFITINAHTNKLLLGRMRKRNIGGAQE